MSRGEGGQEVPRRGVTRSKVVKGDEGDGNRE